MAVVSDDHGDAGPNGGPKQWVDRRVLDSTGDSIGLSVAVYADRATRQPEWIAVYTGRPDAVVVVIPTSGSSLLGDDIVVRHGGETIFASPAVHPASTLEPAEQASLGTHYRRRRVAHPLAPASHRAGVRR